MKELRFILKNNYNKHIFNLALRSFFSCGVTFDEISFTQIFSSDFNQIPSVKIAMDSGIRPAFLFSVYFKADFLV